VDDPKRFPEAEIDCLGTTHAVSRESFPSPALTPQLALIFYCCVAISGIVMTSFVPIVCRGQVRCLFPIATYFSKAGGKGINGEVSLQHAQKYFSGDYGCRI
jgi:hypothetical protein